MKCVHGQRECTVDCVCVCAFPEGVRKHGQTGREKGQGGSVAPCLILAQLLGLKVNIS